MERMNKEGAGRQAGRDIRVEKRKVQLRKGSVTRVRGYQGSKEEGVRMERMNK